MPLADANIFKDFWWQAKYIQLFSTPSVRTSSKSCIVKLLPLYVAFVCALAMSEIKVILFLVRPSVLIHQHVSHWTVFLDIL
jgi:hypothetical protein